MNRGVAVGPGQGLRHRRTPTCIALDADHRQEGLGQDLRRRAGRRERHGRSAGRQGHGHRRELRRGVRRARPPRRVQRSRPASASGAATWCPKPGEPGSETWPADGEAWARGGANCWVTSTFDPELNLLYCGHRQPGARLRRRRPRGRQPLHRLSGVAVDVDTGEIKLRTTSTPRTTCGTTTASMEHILFDLGRAQAARPTSTRTGTSSSWTARTVRWSGCSAVRRPHRLGRGRREGQRDAEGLPRQGRATRSTSSRGRPAPRNGRTRPTARSTELLYVPVQDVGATATRRRREFKESIPYWGRGVAGGRRGHDRVDQRLRPAHRRGELALAQRASRCARRCWPRAAIWCSAASPPVSSTRCDASSGELLWQFQCGSGHHSSPIDLQRRRPAVRRRAGRLGRLGRGFLPGMLGAVPRKRPDRLRPPGRRSA